MISTIQELYEDYLVEDNYPYNRIAGTQPR